MAQSIVEIRNFKFLNLLGSVYKQGNLEFTSDGFTIISPVGNRITFFNLKASTSKTLPVESKTNITCISLSPNGLVLLAGNENGEVLVISLVSETILHILKPGENVRIVKFSPDGTYFAIAKDDVVMVHASPTNRSVIHFMDLKRTISDVDNITDIAWSYDSKILVVSSDQGNMQVYPVVKFKNFKPTSLAAGTHGLIASFFINDSYDFYSVDRDGVLRLWETLNPSVFMEDVENEEPEEVSAMSKKRIKIEQDPNMFCRYQQGLIFHYNELFKTGEKRPPITCAVFNPTWNFLVTGFGETFFLHEMPEFIVVQSFKISEEQISTICINATAEWLAFGCANAGQLIVWEWKSESYIMKQQGHSGMIECIDFSPKSDLIVTGGDDSKVKIWNKTTSFCFMTYHEHADTVTSVRFTRKGNAIISSSLDGSVRAYDLKRYRNFRTFLAPKSVQLGCVTLDPTDELVLACGKDVFEIYAWSLKTGLLLDVLSGHEGAITQVCFSTNLAHPYFVSVSLDRTLRIWESIERSGVSDRIELNSEATCVAISPCTDMLAVGCMNASLTFFNSTGTEIGSVNGAMFLPDTVLPSEATKMQQTNKFVGKEFRTLSFSPDGEYVLAGGCNRVILMFSARSQNLTASFCVSENHSMAGVSSFLNHRQMSEFGNVDLIEDRDESKDTLPLPGAKSSDMASRKFLEEVRVTSVKFASNGTNWAAATTEGILLYGIPNNEIFDPIGADVSVTTTGVEEALKNNRQDKALLMALKLNIPSVTRKCIEAINIDNVHLIVQNMNIVYVRLLLKFLSNELRENPNLGLHMKWIGCVMCHHVLSIRNNESMMPVLNDLKHSISLVNRQTISLIEYNQSTLLSFGRTCPAASLDQMNSQVDNLASGLQQSLFISPNDGFRAGSVKDEDDDDTSSSDSDVKNPYSVKPSWN